MLSSEGPAAMPEKKISKPDAPDPIRVPGHMVVACLGVHAEGVTRF